MAVPFDLEGLPGGGFPGFSGYLSKYGYSNEKDIVSILPNLDPIQQVKLDIKLNMNATDTFPNDKSLLVSDSSLKRQLIPVFQGKIKDPRVIQSLIRVVERGIKSHQNRVSNQLTGSSAWNATWIKVYQQWLNRLNGMLNNYEKHQTSSETS
jgi:hypothetical protein